MYKADLRKIAKATKSLEMIWCILNSEKVLEGEITKRDLGTMRRHIDKVETTMIRFLNGPTID